MRLLLIRHGQTSSNLIHALDTAAPGADLSEFGHRQAGAIPGALDGETIDGLYVSNLIRTHSTARPLAQARGLEMQVREGLREISAGALEMRNDQEALLEYVHTVFHWQTDPHMRLGGGENCVEVLARFDAVVREIHGMHGQGERTAAIVSHGAVLRFWAGMRARNADLADFAKNWLANTGMIVLEGDPEAGYEITRWHEHALGGAEFDDLQHAGPAAEPDPAPWDPEVGEEFAKKLQHRSNPA